MLKRVKGAMKTILKRVMPAFYVAYVILFGVAFQFTCFSCERAIAAEEKVIEIIAPKAGAVYKEGEVCHIEWHAEGIKKISIAVAVGGKDRGLLESKGGKYFFDAQKGFFEWVIPEGFVTSFGVEERDNVRVMIFDAEDPETQVISDYFTIKGKLIDGGQVSEAPSDFRMAAQNYYSLITEGKYKEAFELLFPEKITMTFANGSSVSFGPRPDYSLWLEEKENIANLILLGLKEVPVPNKEMSLMGIRCFQADLEITFKKMQLSTMPSGKFTHFLYLVKGNDGTVRILGIGTGP